MYVGGWFASINDRPRKYLAAVDARTGRLLRWNPRPNWPVQALATDSRTVYAGGLFTRIGRAQRRRLAAFDATTGALKAWNPRVTGSVRETFEPEVTALLFARGRVYVGGLFTAVGRHQRTGVAAIDAATGAADPLAHADRERLRPGHRGRRPLRRWVLRPGLAGRRRRGSR